MQSAMNVRAKGGYGELLKSALPVAKRLEQLWSPDDFVSNDNSKISVVHTIASQVVGYVSNIARIDSKRHFVAITGISTHNRLIEY